MKTIDEYLQLRSAIENWRADDDAQPVLVRTKEGLLRLRADVPSVRAECPKTRPCPHVHCQHHLWMVDSADMPGRRGPGRRPPGSTLRPVWLWPEQPPSCALDLAEREHDAAEIGKYLGVTRRFVEMVIKRAKERMGMSEAKELVER